MPEVPAAVYLVLQVTSVSPVERTVCGWWANYQGCICLCLHTVRKTPAVPEVGLLLCTTPTSALVWEMRASEATLPTSCSNTVIPGVSEVEKHCPWSVKTQHAAHPLSLCSGTPSRDFTNEWTLCSQLLNFEWLHCCPWIRRQPCTDKPQTVICQNPPYHSTLSHETLINLSLKWSNGYKKTTDRKYALQVFIK